MYKIKIEPLTQKEFAQFGDVIQTEGCNLYYINQGQTERYHALSKVDVTDNDNPLISIFRARPYPFPIKIAMLERHPLSSQAFFPLNGLPFLIVVAPVGEQILESKIRVFITNGRQGVNYHKGVWHYPILALYEVTDMIVVDRGGSDNCDEMRLNHPFVIEYFDIT